MAFPWFRFYHEWADDDKVQTMPFEWQRHFVMILCWHASGKLKSYTDHVIAKAFRMKAEELAEMKAEFKALGFITGSGWTPKNWEKRQRPSDRSAGRTKDYRDRIANASKNACDSHVTEKPLNSDDDDIENENSVIQSSSEGKPSRDRHVTVTRGSLCDAGVTVTPDPALSNLDGLVEEVEQTWPGSPFPQLVYELGRTYLPGVVAYGFRQAIGMAWKGEKMTARRIRGLVKYAHDNQLTDGEGIGRGVKDLRPRQPVNGRPKTEKQIWREEMAARAAELKAKRLAAEAAGEPEL